MATQVLSNVLQRAAVSQQATHGLDGELWDEGDENGDVFQVRRGRTGGLPAVSMATIVSVVAAIPAPRGPQRSCDPSPAMDSRLRTIVVRRGRSTVVVRVASRSSGSA